MKLSISITDCRNVEVGYYTSPPKTEEYERVSITDAEANGAVTAAVLRSIADDLDPRTPRYIATSNAGNLR